MKSRYIHCGLSLFHGHAWLQFCNANQESGIIETGVCGICQAVDEVNFGDSCAKDVESRIQNRNHRCRRCVDEDTAPEHIRVGPEMVLPEFIADCDTVQSLLLIHGVRGDVAQESLDTQQRKQPHTDVLHTDAFRRARARHGHHVRPRNGFNLLEYLIVGSPVGYVGTRYGFTLMRKPRKAIKQSYESVLVGIRKWTQEKRINRSENCGSAADADGERQDCDQRKCRVLAESTNCITEVLPYCFDPTRHGCDADHAKV